MSDYVFEPAGDHILVLDSPSAATIGGIQMPDNVKEQEMVAGRVIFIGPEVHQSYTHIQDQVFYGPYAGKTIIVDGVQFRLIREGQIEGYVRLKNDRGTETPNS